MSTTGQRPTISDAQLIGAKAEKCFGARCPENWIPDSGTGTADFGIDYSVQAFENGQASDSFRVQLKGTQSPKLNATGTHFSVDLKASTVRYYERFIEPILLVLCDLSVNAKAVDCPLYYVWIHEELKRINVSDLPDEQISVTLHVPMAQVLDEDTNLAKDIAQSRALAKVGESLQITLEKQNPSLDADARVAMLQKIPRAFAERSPALMESMAEEPATPWPVRPVDSMPWYIGEIERYLAMGALERASQLLNSAEQKLDKATAVEVGDYWLMKGRFYLFNQSQLEACDAFKKASEAVPNNPKHLAAWAETEMARRFSLDEPNNFEDIHLLLTSSAPEILAVKARLFAAEKKDDEAEAILASFTGSEQLSTKAIFRTMRARWKEVIEVCDTGLTGTNVKDSTRLLFGILKVRAQFHLAVDLKPDPSDGRLRSPLPGTPKTNIALVAEAWVGMTAAVEGLRAAGWPANTEFIADIYGAAASILNKEDEALRILEAGAEKRHNLPILQESIESLAAQIGNFDLAIKANLRQASNTTTTLRHAFLLHMAKRDKDCVWYFESHLSSMSTDHPMFAETLIAATMSADRIVRTDLAEKWSTLFDDKPELADQQAILTYLLATIRNKANRANALDALFVRFQELGKPSSIAIQLFHDLNPHDTKVAPRIIEVAEVLMEGRLFQLEGVLQLAQAYTTLERWDDLLTWISTEQTRFPDNGTVKAIQALGLDRLGRTAEARNLLSPLIDSGTTNEFILGAYIDISVRCGFIEEAISAAESLTSAEKDKDKKRDHLRLLHNLVRAKNPEDLRAHEIAWRMGQLTDPCNESDEAVFLIAMRISPPPGVPDPARIEEFLRRLQDFNDNFPTSKILKSAVLPDDATPDQILEMVMKLTGSTWESIEAQNREREELKESNRHAPFEWKPQLFQVARDLPQLWEASKQSKGDRHATCLPMIMGQWSVLPWSQISERVPLMDMVSLLVAYDLGILELIFKLFPKVAVPQRVMFNIGRLSDPFAGSAYFEKCRSIQKLLQTNFEQVLQPLAPIPESESRYPEFIRNTEELKKMARQALHLLYSDDAVTRIFCKGHDEDFQSICTLDVLSAMAERGLLSQREVAQKIGVLCRWGVGMIIESKWQIASLPETAISSQSVAEGVEAIRNDEACMAIFDGIWDRPDCNFIDRMSQAKHLVVSMLYEHKLSAKVTASLMAIWCEKAIGKLGSPSPDSVIPALLFQNSAIQAMQSYPKINRSGQLWNVYLLLVEHRQGVKLSNDNLIEAVDTIAIAAASLDLHIRWLSQSSLRLFLSSGLKDTGFSKLRFLDSYWHFRRQFIGELGKISPPFTHLFTFESRPAYWSHWARNNTSIDVHWKTPCEAFPERVLAPVLGGDGLAPAYLYRWQRSEISDIVMRWRRISPNTLGTGLEQ